MLTARLSFYPFPLVALFSLLRLSRSLSLSLSLFHPLSPTRSGSGVRIRDAMRYPPMSKNPLCVDLSMGTKGRRVVVVVSLRDRVPGAIGKSEIHFVAR